MYEWTLMKQPAVGTARHEFDARQVDAVAS
jgi:hypothetical protein